MVLRGGATVRQPVYEILLNIAYNTTLPAPVVSAISLSFLVSCFYSNQTLKLSTFETYLDPHHQCLQIQFQ